MPYLPVVERWVNTPKIQIFGVVTPREIFGTFPIQSTKDFTNMATTTSGEETELKKLNEKKY